MAGDVTVAVVSGTIASTDTGTADFTKTDFGTPKACIVLLTSDNSDDTNAINSSRMSIGFSDFTNDFCIAHQDQTGTAKVNCDAIKSNVACYLKLNNSGAKTVEGTASAIADGVRLTNILGEFEPFCTVIMFGGADLADDLRSTTINSSQDGTATITHSGLTDGNDKLIFFIGTDIAAEDSSSTGINSAFGVCHISGNDAGGYTFVQRCIGGASDHNNTDGTPHGVISTDRVLDMITEAGSQDWGLEVTAFSNSGGTITVTTRDNGAGAGMEVYSFIVDLDDRKAKVGSVDGPTSGATWDPSVSLTFTPQYVGLMLTDLTNEDTITSDAEAGVMGISSNTGTGEETCHSWYNEDAIGTINTNNLFRSRAIDLRDDDVTTVLQDHSHSAFDSTGWTYTINTENETVAKKWGFWTIEEATAVSFTATGALTLGTIAISGVGVAGAEGVGTLALAVPSIVGAGIEELIGAGTLILPVPTISGIGVGGAEGTGALLIAAPAIVGSGVEKFTATGALAFAVPAIVGTGVEVFTATGTLLLNIIAITGTGLMHPSASASLVLGPPLISGSGVEEFIASGALVLTVPAIAGTGTGGAPPEGTGALLLAVPSIVGVGVMQPSATGVITIPGLSIAGTGVAGADGVGALALGPPLIAGTGVEEFIASGALALNVPTISGTGSYAGGASGIGTLLLGVPTIAGIGARGLVTEIWTEVVTTTIIEAWTEVAPPTTEIWTEVSTAATGETWTEVPKG